MLTVSDEALGYLRDLLNQSGEVNGAIRVAVMGNSGLGIIVDQAGEKDARFEQDGLPVIIDQGLLDYCKSISITFTTGDGGECGTNGYIITAENPLTP